jgi:hypothetical protein
MRSAMPGRGLLASRCVGIMTFPGTRLLPAARLRRGLWTCRPHKDARAWSAGRRWGRSISRPRKPIACAIRSALATACLLSKDAYAFRRSTRRSCGAGPRFASMRQRAGFAQRMVSAGSRRGLVLVPGGAPTPPGNGADEPRAQAPHSTPVRLRLRRTALARASTHRNTFLRNIVKCWWAKRAELTTSPPRTILISE